MALDPLRVAVLEDLLGRTGADAGGVGDVGLAGIEHVVTPSPDVAAAVRTGGAMVTVAAPATASPGGADAVLLVDDELAAAGDHAEELLAETARALRPRGVLAVSAPTPLLGEPASGRAFDAEALVHALGHRGFAVEALWAPGAAARLRGSPSRFDPDLDRRPGLLDAGPRLVAVARAPVDGGEASRHFFASLPRKVVAAAVVCCDARDRLLVVHDSFKGHWTVPGGVVDAAEDPQTAAVREAWEEAGVQVRAGALLGIFGGVHPDRLVVLYAAEPLDRDGPPPATRHPHEIDAAEWVPLGAALQRLAPSIRAQVSRCLDDPGRTWPAGTWEP